MTGKLNDMADAELIKKFDHLKKESKVIFKNIHQGAPDFLIRFKKSNHPNFKDLSTSQLLLNIHSIKLHHVHWMLARELGYKSWAHLKNAVETSSAQQLLVSDFINNAIIDDRFPNSLSPSRAVWMLEAAPDALKKNFLVAVITGQSDFVLDQIRMKPEWVHSEMGPKEWPPLLYLAYSIFLTPKFGCQDWQVRGFPKIVKSFLDAGADPHAAYYLQDFCKTLRNIRHGFKLAQRFDLLKILDEKSSNAQKISSLPSEKLVLFQGSETLASQENRKAEALKKSYHLLKELEKANVDQIEEILKHGANPNFSPPHFNGKCALHVSLSLGRSDDILSLLLDYGADPVKPDNAGMTPIRLGMRYGRLKFLGEVRSRGQLSSKLFQPVDEFWCAVFLGQIEEADRLFHSCGMDVKRLDSGSVPLFSRAAYFGNKLAVRILLDLGFDQSLTDEKGMTPLHWAVWRADKVMLEWLLKAEDAPLGQQSSYDATPLDTAIFAGQKKPEKNKDYLEIIRILLDAGSQLNQETQLFLADMECNLNDPDSELHKIFWMEGFECLEDVFSDLPDQNKGNK